MTGRESLDTSDEHTHAAESNRQRAKTKERASGQGFARSKRLAFPAAAWVDANPLGKPNVWFDPRGYDFIEIARCGQASSHALQSMQSSGFTTAFSSTLMALDGQLSSQVLQPSHFSGSTMAGMATLPF